MKKKIILLLGLSTSVSAQAVGGYTNTGVNYIYALLFPILALIFMLSAYHFKENFLPSYISGLFWFVGTVTTRNIKFIDDFEAASNPYYVHLGNPEFNWLYMGLGILMFVYGTLIILKDLKRQTTTEAAG